MTLNLGTILSDSGINPMDAIAIRHSYRGSGNEGGLTRLSTPREIMEYTSSQSLDPRRFPAEPARFWLIFMADGQKRSRLWKVLENHGEISRDEVDRVFELRESAELETLCGRLVVDWKVPRNWCVSATTASAYPVREIAAADVKDFPGFDKLDLTYEKLGRVIGDSKYQKWQAALKSVKGIYLIRDDKSGKLYVGKADGKESLFQRWSSYVETKDGGNVRLKGLDPDHFHFAVLRVFDPGAATRDIDQAENHFKTILGTREHGLNGN